MSVATEIARIQGAKADLKTAIEAKGVTVPSNTKIDGYATLVGQISGGGGANLTTLNVTPTTSAQQITPTSPVDGYDEVNVSAVTSAIDANITAGNIKNGVSILGVTGNYEGDVLPATLPVGATTVQYDATHTENVASNDHIRILGSDNKRYTIAQWNAMFVAAGYNKDNMPVSPKGLSIDAFERAGECYIFNTVFAGQLYIASGSSQMTAKSLRHFIYNNPTITAADSGTDSTTSKTWSVTANGDNLTLEETNTGQSWVIGKNQTADYVVHKHYNIHERTYGLWAINEWMRHRMAISSGVTTTKANGTMGEIAIFNASGVQAAVNEDMYFWIKNDSNVWTNTNILAKYNINNLHKSNATLLTTTIRDAIYAAQKTAGINMNDTGVNSSNKPILAPGSKGAEVIAVNGTWMIITPFVSNPSATVTNANANMIDSPAIYWAIYNDCDLPSDTLICAMAFNKTLVGAAVSYLTNREGWSITAFVNATTWTTLYTATSYGCIARPDYGNTASLSTRSTPAAVFGALYIPES